MHAICRCIPISRMHLHLCDLPASRTPRHTYNDRIRQCMPRFSVRDYCQAHYIQRHSASEDCSITKASQETPPSLYGPLHLLCLERKPHLSQLATLQQISRPVVLGLDAMERWAGSCWLTLGQHDIRQQFIMQYQHERGGC